MPGWERLQNDFNTEHTLPQQLALFSETSVTWGPITLYRRGTAEAKPRSATTWLYLPHSFIALHCFVLPLTQICLSAGALTPQLPGVPRSLAEVRSPFRGAARTRHTQFFTFAPLWLPGKQKPSEIALLCAYKVFNSVFAVFSSYGKTVQRNEPFPGLESCAAND